MIFHNTESFYIPISNVGWFWFLHLLANTYFLFFKKIIIATLGVVMRYLIMVLICISMVINEVQYPFMCFFAICTSSLGKCLIKSFAHFLAEFFLFVIDL